MDHDVQLPPPADETRLADKYLEIAFRILVLGGLGLVLLGSAVQLIVQGHLQAELIAPEELLKSMAELQPQVLTTLGFITLMIGPATGLLVLIWTYARQRELLIPLVALLVFTIILLGVPIEHWTRGL